MLMIVMLSTLKQWVLYNVDLYQILVISFLVSELNRRFLC
ncbi:hypothetical protein GNIT_1970 [Glaciecola nitratireducens FR1064]|uniref:Uncharacterized protein n=1 Tax=Glaciecola nitratireducens (strain JCM 12485 / KCTC 12276 / FR1064) TaxID=1085623 RepID=G4QKL3_GLANF|nr:hypothetical protein GNIT_1970 [Glaciecola nitratireducens FR1064]